MSYEEFFATCNVFPAVNFERYSLLGMDETGTDCTVSFARRVFRDDEKKRIVFQLTVVEEGACETTVRDRNLILVPRIPPDHDVTFEDGATFLPPGGVSRGTDPLATPATLHELVDGNNRFAFDLFQAVAQEEGNLFFSPYSIWTALAMTYAGAQGETAAQMADTLHYTLPQAQLHPTANALNLRLTAGDDEEEFELDMANALWGQEDIGFRQEYLDLLATHYAAGLRPVDFQSQAGREAAAKWINQWISDATDERITDMADPRRWNNLTRLVLTNAIAFDGLWQQPLDEDTEKAGFTLLDGSSVRIPLMQCYATITPYAAGEGWQSAGLAYQGGSA